MKEYFNKLLKDIKPFLKSHGFKKKSLNFYRQNEEIIYLINFQKSHGNSSEEIKFYINAGLYSPKINQIINKDFIFRA